MYALNKNNKKDSFEIILEDFDFLKEGSKIEIEGELREIEDIWSIEYTNGKVLVKGKLKMMMEEKTHFEAMEELGQISLFDLIEQKEEKTKLPCDINVGDKVRCNITEQSDWEAHNYLTHYAPFALKDVGEVVSVDINLALVRYKSTELMFNIKELEV